MKNWLRRGVFTDSAGPDWRGIRSIRIILGGNAGWKSIASTDDFRIVLSIGPIHKKHYCIVIPSSFKR